MPSPWNWNFAGWATQMIVGLLFLLAGASPETIQQNAVKWMALLQEQAYYDVVWRSLVLVLGGLMLVSANRPLIGYLLAKTRNRRAHSDPQARESSLAFAAMPSPSSSGRYFDRCTLRIADLIEPDGYIRNRTFDDCTIMGPAVLLPVPGRPFVLDGCTLDPDAHTLADMTKGRSAPGAIPLDGCVFRSCRLPRVSFIGAQEAVDPPSSGQETEI
jgi:hypothetical protein